MRRIWTTLLALPLVFASCSETPAADTKPAAGTIEVSIGSGPKIGIRTGVQTRTELDGDGESVRWADNDRIVLWAVNSQAQTTIDRQVFKLWHYNAEYNTAKFTATVPEMPEDTYVYYAVSPEPVSAEGLKASYRIPAEQDGTFSGDCDIMVAAPVEGTALQQGDNSEMVNLEFDHKVHVLMIRIPSNDLGEEISKITLTFPEPVAGTLTVDAADPAAAADRRQQHPDTQLRHPEEARRYGLCRHRAGGTHVGAGGDHHGHGHHPRIAAEDVPREAFRRGAHHPDLLQHSARRPHHPARQPARHRQEHPR